MEWIHHLRGLADGESTAERILVVQKLQQGTVHPVLYGVHHLCLCQDSLPLLLDARCKELRLKCDLCQCAQNLHVSLHHLSFLSPCHVCSLLPKALATP